MRTILLALAVFVVCASTALCDENFYGKCRELPASYLPDEVKALLYLDDAYWTDDRCKADATATEYGPATRQNVFVSFYTENDKRQTRTCARNYTTKNPEETSDWSCTWGQ